MHKSNLWPFQYHLTTDASSILRIIIFVINDDDDDDDDGDSDDDDSGEDDHYNDDDDLQVKTVLSMYQKHKVSVGSLTGQVLNYLDD